MIGAVVTRAAMTGSGPPVDPDAPTARRWAVQELAKPEYHTGPNLLQRLMTWISDQIDRLQHLGGSGLGASLVVVAVVVGVVVVVAVLAGPVRRARAVAGPAGGGLLDDDTRTAEQIRAAAQAAAAAGHLALAVAEWFRALVRDLEERALLDERPGRTADEAARAAAARLPDLAGDLADAARVFDATVYGHRDARPADEAQMRGLAQRARQARPTRPPVPEVVR